MLILRIKTFNSFNYENTTKIYFVEKIFLLNVLIYLIYIIYMNEYIKNKMKK